MSKAATETRTIKVDYLARVEGEGALYVKIHDGSVENVQLQIFEPPRFFEAFLRGRNFMEAPDITARICGICPIAYMNGAAHAMEMAAGVEHPGGPIRALRRLIYAGEWIESHVLHIYMLHAPDFLGYHDAIALAKDHRDVVEKALRMKKIGNDLMTLIGGREIHPVNPRVGGFYKAPRKADLLAMVDDLKWGLEAAKETVAFTNSLPTPDFEQDYEYISLRHPDEYAMNEGRLFSNKGLDVSIVGGYDDYLIEQHVAHSTALQSRTKNGDTVSFGPLARYANNLHQLSPEALATVEKNKLPEAFYNPFKSIVARSVEVVYAFEEALRIINEYEEPEKGYVDVPPKAGTGYGATEAPRGICYHRYTIDDTGIIQDAKIVAPTSVNQATMEKDLLAYIPPRIDMDEDRLRHECEQAIRNYDPCISCSAHFLKLTVDRS
jgi:coenzyme F420-reducing hydrogenase alpha subunit